MKEMVKCKICGKETTANNSYIGSHVKRMHNIGLYDYIKLYYEWENKEFKYETCGFCDNEAVPNFEINHKELTYKLNYNLGYFCNTINCRENISLLIFQTPYNKKTFEFIGSHSKYLSLLYKRPVDIVKYKKSKGLRENNFTASLDGFINKFGEDLGKIKYKERNTKISKSNTKSWYLEKFGGELGKQKWEIYRNKITKKLGSSKSKTSTIINSFLDKNNIKYKEEYKYENSLGQTGLMDFYLLDYNIVIEYYGDYWHCNPNLYESNYFHKICKKFSYEIWEKDKNRINYIFQNEFKNKVSILIIWESTKFGDEYLLNLLEKIKNKNVIVEI